MLSLGSMAFGAAPVAAQAPAGPGIIVESDEDPTAGIIGTRDVAPSPNPADRLGDREHIDAAALAVLERNRRIDGEKSNGDLVLGHDLLPGDTDWEGMPLKKATWCNNFATELGRKLDIKIPWDDVGKIQEYLSKSDSWGAATNLKDAAERQRAGYLVFASSEDHIAALVDRPTEEVKLPKGMEVRPAGVDVWVAQAGAFTGYGSISQAWTASALQKDVRFYYYKGRIP